VQNTGNAGRYFVIDAIRRDERIRLMIQHCHRAGERVFGSGVREQVIERRAERVEIAARVCSETLNLFERRVVWRVTKNAGAGSDARDVARLSLGKTEVQNFCVSFTRNEDIGRLQVTMHDPFAVRRCKRIGD
jgi:hypothetical protein